MTQTDAGRRHVSLTWFVWPEDGRALVPELLEYSAHALDARQWTMLLIAAGNFISREVAL